jgi:hypothetical protein
VTVRLVEQASRYYGNLGLRPNHPGAASHEEYFDRLWRGKGRQPELDSPEEQRGYEEARAAYVAGCKGLRVQVARDPTLLTRLHLRATRAQPATIRRPRSRPRGAGRPAARPARRGGDSGDSDSSDSDDGSDGPGVSRALSAAQIRADHPP